MITTSVTYEELVSYLGRGKALLEELRRSGALRAAESASTTYRQYVHTNLQGLESDVAELSRLERALSCARSEMADEKVPELVYRDAVHFDREYVEVVVAVAAVLREISLCECGACGPQRRGRSNVLVAGDVAALRGGVLEYEVVREQVAAWRDMFLFGDKALPEEAAVSVEPAPFEQVVARVLHASSGSGRSHVQRPSSRVNAAPFMIGQKAASTGRAPVPGRFS